ncbi:MAG: hypothetical protein EXR72_03025 [Myxococcales bacterium]|nr:hypothetical protein [Myxococcales bacterium]
MKPVDPSLADARKWRWVFSLEAARSLATVSAELTGAGVAFAPVKGVVLSRWLYDDVCDRPYVDVDLLVSRAQFGRARDLVRARGWRVLSGSDEMGELQFGVGRVLCELHAEMGRPDLLRLSVAEVLARAEVDRTTFPFAISRIDDLDHFLLLVANVVKDGFTYANPHQPADLERLLCRLQPRLDALLDRARDCAAVTALHTTTAWMIEEHASEAFAHLKKRLPPLLRPTFAMAVRLHRGLARRGSDRLSQPSGLLGLVLATLAPDDRALRRRGLWRLVRRGVLRKLGRDPG